LYGKIVRLAKKAALEVFLLLILYVLMLKARIILSVRVVCTSLQCVAERFFYAPSERLFEDYSFRLQLAFKNLSLHFFSPFSTPKAQKNGCLRTSTSYL